MTSKTSMPRQNRKWPLWLVMVFGGCLLAGLSWFVYDRLMFRPIGEIAYECYSGICIVDVQSGWTTQIISRPGESPTWSPDGKYLAFISGKLIQTYNRQSSELDVLWRGGDNISLRRIIWSPEGTKLLLEARLNQQEGLYLIELKDAKALNEPQLLIEKGNVPLYRSAFSSSGVQVYFYDRVKSNPNDSKTYRINIDGTDKQKLSFDCPDLAIELEKTKVLCREINQYFVFDISKWHEDFDIEFVSNWSIALSGIYEPSWSPDGQYIVYSQTFWPGFMGNNNGELWIMKADGSHPVKLTSGPSDRNPAWRPKP